MFTLVSFLELPCVRSHRTRHHVLENRDEDDRKQDQTKTSHELLHALALRTMCV